MNLFKYTDHPPADLFFEKSDPYEKSLGTVVKRFETDFQAAEWIIVGCPQDDGVWRNGGRRGAKEAPPEIRRQVYKLPAPEQIDGKIFDLGDLRIRSQLEETHDNLAAVLVHILKSGKKAIVLGGGNDISYPDCLALSQVYKDILAFNIDSHLDLRQADAPHSGTPYRQLLDEKHLLPARFYEIGIKPEANAMHYARYAKKQGVSVHTLDAVRRKGVRPLLGEILQKETADAIFWGFDMDVVRASDAPGVSAGYPTGLTAEEACELAAIAGNDPRSRIFEISEVNPAFDLDYRTSKLAAMMILRFVGAQ